MSRKLVPALILLVGLALSACGTTAPAQTPAQPKVLREITLAMPYIPNVQFAQFYMADKQGYYAAEGIKVNFDYNFETDVVKRVAEGSVQFGMASGDSVLLARGQGLPVRVVATNSQRFPAVFFSKADQNIKTPADLKGKKVGIPGRFGASYVGLLAILYANKIAESELDIQEIGFAQIAALTEGKVQVVSGYGNNEPIQMEQQGISVNVIKVSDSFPLASDGIIASEQLIKDSPDLVRGFVRATLHGMQDVINSPQAGFDTALIYIPEAQRGDTKLQLKVLEATTPFWQSDLTKQNGLGFTDAASWQATNQFLRDAKLLKADVKVEEAFTNDFIK